MIQEKGNNRLIQENINIKMRQESTNKKMKNILQQYTNNSHYEPDYLSPYFF